MSRPAGVANGSYPQSAPESRRSAYDLVADIGATGHTGRVIDAIHVLIGASVAILLDWAIYTHLSAYLRIGFPTTPDLGYREIAAGSSMALPRTGIVVGIGAAAGLAVAANNPSLWLITSGSFIVAHSALYALLYKRRQQQ